MAEAFTPITTQEQLNDIITERLKRDREAQKKKIKEEGWLSPEDAKKATDKLQDTVDKLTKEAETARTTIAGHEASIKRYQAAELRSKIADEVGLDRRLVGRLSGETEDDLRKDAQGLKELFGAQTAPSVDPMRSTEPQKGPGGVAGAWGEVSGQLRGE
jgi:hypothetical protein